MQENHLFEYAIVRVVPRVEREEFINVGVILLCAKQKYLHALLSLNQVRLHALCPDMDASLIQDHMRSFERICQGGKEGGPIGLLSQSERFRWLTSSRSTIVQCSQVHPGLCADPAVTLQRLFDQLVQ